MNQDISQNPTLSPVAFTRAYQEYRAIASRTHFADSRLLLAVRFWMGYAQSLESAQFATYWQEDLPPLLSEMHAGMLGDLTAEETEEVAAFVDRAAQVFTDDTLVPNSLVRGIWEAAARKWYYLGQVEQGCEALMKAGICATPCGEEIALFLEEAGPLEAHDIPAFLVDEVRSDYPALSDWLKSFATSWRVEREAGAADAVHCLLVEYDPNGKPVRGRLRRLTGKIEERRKTADSDEIIFHNQLKAPDDPFVGAIYSALNSLRSTISRGNKKSAHRYYRGRFEISGSNSDAYSGNSIGLTAFATVYGCWWNSEIHRERKLISHGVVITGGVDSNESVQPVAKDTLEFKIDRAFRSPLSYVVVPEANRKAAERIVETLRGHYPRRRLHIIGVERPGDIIADNNIFRPEKVCPTTFVYQKARHYTRSVKVQAPILLLLGYLLACIIHPPLWIFFDRNPQYVRVTETGFEALNADSTTLWTETYDCPRIVVNESYWRVGDINRDGKNEVAFCPKVHSSYICDCNTDLFVYDRSGNLLYRGDCAIMGEFPADNSPDAPYSPLPVDFIQCGDSIVILTRAYISNPARTHYRFWSANGDPMGWYIHFGHNGGHAESFVQWKNDMIFILDYNNPVGRICVFGIDPLHSRGVGPPYDSHNYDLSQCTRGNQLVYLTLPQSDVNKAAFETYVQPQSISAIGPDSLKIEVRESETLKAFLEYYLDSNLRIFRVKAPDGYIKARNRLVHDGKLRPIDWNSYLSDLRDSVQYWSDSGWVSEGALRAAEQGK